MEKHAVIVYFYIEMKGIIKEFSELVGTYGRLFRCSVCFHDYSGDVFKTADFSLNNHMNLFCQLVKENQYCGKRCIEFDSLNVRHFFSSGKKELVKICHAGALEFAVPVFSENRLCGAVFLGPFRPSKSGKMTGVIIQEPEENIPSDAKRLFKSLPEIEDSKLGDMLGMTRLLAEKLGRTITSFNRDYILGQGYADKIPYFINREFKNGISIANLAEFLSLSVSRTSRVVKLHAGKTFPELLAEKRVEHAKFLLENSFFNMEMVSKQCGFSEPAYFFRTFKRRQKITPTEYRKRLKGKTAPTSV
ncbi:MAG: helix-turn-helix domain-containing protein [Victivallales bacterium]